MSEALFVGGFLGSQRYIDHVCGILEDECGLSIDGITVEHALQSPEETHERAFGKDVVTHSMGAVALWNALADKAEDEMPLSVTMVAPPIPVHLSRLTGRGARIAYEAWHDQTANRQIMNGLARASLRDVFHYAHSMRALPQLSKFNACEAAREYVAKDTPTRVVVMDDERFFEPNSRRYAEGLLERDQRFQVVYLPGNHLTEACDPAFVYQEIERQAPHDTWLPAA